jgi:hypothetical protein
MEFTVEGNNVNCSDKDSEKLNLKIRASMKLLKKYYFG